MRTTSTVTVSGIAALALTGCVSLGPGESQTSSPTAESSPSPSEPETTHPVDDDEFFSEMLTAIESVENLRMEVTLDFELEAPWITETQRVEMITEATEDFSQGHATIELEDQGQLVETMEAYFHDDGAVENIDGQGWETMSGHDAGDEEDSRYSHVVDSIAEIDDFLEVDYDDETYTLDYTGNDVEIFEAFEEPFSLSLDGYEPEDTEMSVEVVVDAETFFVEDFSLTLDTEETSNPIELGMEIAAQFSKFNEISDLEVPEEVLEEAGVLDR